MPEPLKLTEVEAVIRAKMPRCDARGIVWIVLHTTRVGSKKGSLIHQLLWMERFLREEGIVKTKRHEEHRELARKKEQEKE
ncbi:hypothetical protein PILCRDRAFT_16062 [Piloderma croceum F 1598]|uniref:Uncharacterized protein n=1 Tax=Piloderma croceum (strain F 1598) TaxID=765440 RepID=A0A0C3EIP7_PILCF|nr:hypothetical protein PILCRDRAFT_16062 [Piloderma croceum F 1598]